MPKTKITELYCIKESILLNKLLKNVKKIDYKICLIYSISAACGYLDFNVSLFTATFRIIMVKYANELLKEGIGCFKTLISLLLIILLAKLSLLNIPLKGYLYFIWLCKFTFMYRKILLNTEWFKFLI